jgi:hypothetical protein
MLVLLIITAAPIIQITLSTLRVKGRIGLPIGSIMFLTLLLGVVLSISLTVVIPPYISPSGLRCGTGPVVVAMGSIFIQFVASPAIGIISYIIYRFKQKDIIYE